MGIINDGRYKPREDLLARCAALMSTLWGVPVFLGALWVAVILWNSVSTSRSSGMAYGFAYLVTLVAVPIFVLQCIYAAAKSLRRNEKLSALDRKGLKKAFLLACLIALGAAGMPWMSLWMERSLQLLAGVLSVAGWLLSCCWLVVAARAIRRYHKYGLTLLIAAPLALYWPFWMVLLESGCATGRGCL
jgi:hypothetical protein